VAEINGIFIIEKSRLSLFGSTYLFMLSSFKEAFSKTDELILITDVMLMIRLDNRMMLTCEKSANEIG